MLAGALTGLLIMPLDMVVTRMQTLELKGGSLEANSANPRSVLGVIQSIYEEGGVTNFWASLEPTLALTLNPGVNMLLQVNTHTLRPLLP